MASFTCTLEPILAGILQIYLLCMLLYAVTSWVPSLQGRWSYYLGRLVEPVVSPLRRVIPPVGGLDLSFLIVMLLLGWVLRALPQTMCPITYY